VKVRVKIIGPLMYVVGFSEKDVEIPEGTKVDKLMNLVGIPKERPKIVTRNGWAIVPDEVLVDDDRIVIAPVYSGG